MNDQETKLREIKDKVLAFARERDWEQFCSVSRRISSAIARHPV